MASPNPYTLLTLEGHLFHASLTSGLTTLRAANIDHKGNFYASFFHLSIGLERLMKVILIIDHMAKNSMQPPSDQTLRKHGHKLVKLFSYLQSLPHPDPNPLTALAEKKLPMRILQFLSEFADGTRYYNLNSIVSLPSPNDPLAAWHSIIEDIFAADITERQRNKAKEIATSMLPPAWDVMGVIGHNLDGTPLTIGGAALLPQIHDLAARHAVYYVLEVVQSLKEVLDHRVHVCHDTARLLGASECPVPYMTEFLDFFYLHRSSILRKKRWP